MDVNCDKCGKCCREEEIGALVLPKDVKPICNRIDISAEKFFRIFCEERKIKIYEREVTIFFLKKTIRGCVFLDENNLCEIYPSRPYHCRMAPFNFFAKYEYWKHMKCVTEQDFVGLDTYQRDAIALQPILNGYDLTWEGGE